MIATLRVNCENSSAREHDDYQNRERDEVLARTACLLVVSH